MNDCRCPQTREQQYAAMEDHVFSLSGSSISELGVCTGRHLPDVALDTAPVPDGALDTDPVDLELLCRVIPDPMTPAVKTDQDVYVPVNCISPEARAFLAAAEAVAVLRADAINSGNVITLHSSSAGLHDPERISLSSMASPKKFHQIFWQSVSLRLLHRWTQTASPSTSDSLTRQEPLQRLDPGC